jgi:hypothetical protein
MKETYLGEIKMKGCSRQAVMMNERNAALPFDILRVIFQSLDLIKRLFIEQANILGKKFRLLLLLSSSSNFSLLSFSCQTFTFPGI